jgi:hypothetical protein
MPDLTLTALRAQVALGEDSSRQFKADVRNAESLASEMAAFANSEGGSLYLGVADDGTIPGLSRDDVGRINQLVSNAASQLVRSPLAVTTRNVALKDRRLVVVVTVPKGLDKPYFDKNGVIWLKTGSDKRRVNSKEELRRLFQMSDQFHADELPTKAGLDALDLLRLRDFLRDTYGQILPEKQAKRLKLLQNMNLATEDGHLNLAGLLLFGEQPQFFKPQFTLKAVRFPGSSIHESEYLDAEDFAGPLPQIYTNAHAFVMRNLPKVQAGRGVNTLGVPQVSPVVFEELLVNASDPPGLPGQRPHPPVRVRRPDRDREPRQPPQQPHRGKDPGGQLQPSQPHPGVFRRQGDAPLPRARVRHPARPGSLAPHRVPERPRRMPLHLRGDRPVDSGSRIRFGEKFGGNPSEFGRNVGENVGDKPRCTCKCTCRCTCKRTCNAVAGKASGLDSPGSAGFVRQTCENGEKGPFNSHAESQPPERRG